MGWIERARVIFLDPEFAAAWHETADPLTPPPDARVLKRGGSTLVFERMVAGGGLSFSVVVKRRDLTGMRRRLASIGRPSRAARSADLAGRMRAKGLRVPRPRCAVEVRRWGIVASSTLVSDRIPHAETLADRLAAGQVAGGGERVPVARAVGDALGRLFGAGFRNRDLKAPNLMIDRDGAVWIVDLDGVRASPPVRGVAARAVRRRDLERLVRDARASGDPSPDEARAFWAAYRRGWRSIRGA